MSEPVAAFPLYNYNAIILRIVDADTVQVTVDLGFSVHFVTSVRLRGINAPEMNTPEGRAARDFLVGILPVGAAVTLNTVKPDKYANRFDAVMVYGGVNINRAVLEAGYAVPYNP